MKKLKKAFTLIELLVVIAIIGILATLAVVALQNSRASARDAKRLADVKQMQTALELYFNDNGSYPTSLTSTIASGSNIYMTTLPIAPTPIDGSCTTTTNAYTYSSNGSTYSITFCLGGRTSGLSSGDKIATRDGVANYTPVAPWACGDTLVDSRDSQQYPTVQIGSQCWMAKNINYDDGCSSNTWVSNTDTRWCGCYNNNTSNCTTYGKLYQWSAAMAGASTEGAQGICPSGWHVPRSAEFIALSTYLGGDSIAGGKLKQAGTSLWLSPNTGATNESNFNALPCGIRNFSGSFVAMNYSGFFWSSSFSGSNVLNRSMDYDYATFSSSSYTSAGGFSVRCMKD